MSGFYGIYRFDGVPVSPDVLARMRAAMAYYGPDGGSSTIQGSLGMGHLLLKTNPEDDFENQPATGLRGIVVSAARLDNRSELLDTLEVPIGERPRLSDGNLVSLAFDRWGEEVCVHLQGDWAMAAWDRAERKLLLARDAFGNSTLYFHQGKGFIAFASSLKALLALPGITKEPDPLRLAQILGHWEHDVDRTAHLGFSRLVWARALSFSPLGQHRSWHYWSPEGRELLAFRKSEDYVEAFLEHYTRSVQSCLRTNKPVAATLSGGRDSGSIVAMAAPLLQTQGRELTAYTSIPAMFPDGATGSKVGNEWDLAHSTATMAGDNVQHIPVDAGDYGVIQGIEHFLDVRNEPGHGSSNRFLLQAVNELAARNGVGVLFAGQMGNATVSWHGNGSALLLLIQGYPRMALEMLLHAEPTLWLTLKRQFLKPLVTPVRRWVSRRNFLDRRPWQVDSALNPQLADALDLDRLMQEAEHDPSSSSSPRIDRRMRFFQPPFCLGPGCWSEISARHGLAVCDPTSNLAMVEFLLRVPDIQFRHKGQGSLLFSRAFQGRLPMPVREGRRRGLQSADVGHRIRKELPAMRQCLDEFDALPSVRAYLDVPRMRRCLEEIVVRVDPETTRAAMLVLLPGIETGLFLRGLA